MAKTGECPRIKIADLSECPPPEDDTNDCFMDSDCNGTKKCCSDGCNLKCMPAQSLPTPTNPVVAKGKRAEKRKPVSQSYILFDESLV